MEDRPRTLGDVITNRRSIRRYGPGPVSPDLIDQLLRCAAAAPSSHHRQPWRFALVEAGDARIGLARAMSARLRSDRLADGDPADLVEADVTRSGRRLTDAPVLIIVALTMVDMDRYADARRSHAEYLMAVQSTGMAMQNLLLAAAEAGLGACVMCGPLFCPDTVGAALQLPADWQPQAAVTMGWPMDSEKDRPRRPRRPLADIMIRRGASSGNRAPTEP